MSLITVQNVKFKYPQSTAYSVDDVSFVIEKGSYTTVLGLNGSGKSTLIKLICGIESPESGSISIPENNRIGIVFQSPKDQIVSGIVSRDTAFGPQNLGLSNAETELRTIECLNIVDMLDRSQYSTSALSLGQTQKVALSGVIALHPEILILDEAISMLDPTSRKEILEFVKYYHKCGNTIIQITHESEVVKDADNVIYMENGKIKFYGTQKAFLQEKSNFVALNGKPLPKAIRVSSANEIAESHNSFVAKDKEISVQFKNVSFKYEKMQKIGVKNINLKLYKGTLTAITGPSGAGKSTILELCAGLLKADKGEIFTSSKPSLAQQNASAALFETFAVDDVAFGPKNNGVQGKELKETVINAMNSAALPFEQFSERRTFALSGGEQRRLSIAGILALNSQIILFDEPTAGLDSQRRYEVMQMIRKLADEGKTVLFSTHHRDEADFADREICVENGEIYFDSLGEIKNKEGKINNQLRQEKQTYQTVSLLESLRNLSLSLSNAGKKKISPIQKLHPSIRILLFIALFVLSLSFSRLWLCISTLLLSLFYAKVCDYKWKTFFRTCAKILPFLLIFTVFQLIFHQPLENEIYFTTWKWFTITPSKLIFCLVSFLRTFSALACICSFFVSTPEYDLIDGLKVLLTPLRIIKIPVRYFILIIEIIFRFIPLLVEEASAIIKTQTIRGGLGKVSGKMAKIRVIIPLIVPLIVQTIKRASSLGVAITMRGFE